MEPEEALHCQILHRKKEGVEELIDRSVEKIGAVPTLNDVLLPAMKEVGDKFGAGELILPFVLQSAEVMKRAVAHLEQLLERIEGHTKGKVVIATVFGDVHDIGKSLVNTILTNNGYTVVDLGKQVPIEHDHRRGRRARGRRDRAVGAARLDLEADAALRPGAAPARARLPGADRRRRDQPRLRPPRRSTRTARSPTSLRARASSTARTPSTGLDTMDALIDDEARAALVGSSATRRKTLREKPEVADDAPAADRRLGALRGRAPTRRSPSRRSGACASVDVDLDEVFPHLDRHVLFKLHWGGRGVKGEAWRKLVEGDARSFGPRLERMWAEQDYLAPEGRLGYFPCNADGNELVVFDPEDPEPRARAARLPAPAQARPHLPRRLLPARSMPASATSSRCRASRSGPR